MLISEQPLLVIPQDWQVAASGPDAVVASKPKVAAASDFAVVSQFEHSELAALTELEGVE